MFNDKKKRSILSSITSKQITKEIIKEIYRICFKEKETMVVLDAPLLFESKFL